MVWQYKNTFLFHRLKGRVFLLSQIHVIVTLTVMSHGSYHIIKKNGLLNTEGHSRNAIQANMVSYPDWKKFVYKQCFLSSLVS